VESQLQIKKETLGYVKELREHFPEVLSLHDAFKEEVYGDGTISSKTKHLMAMAIALARGSMHCSISHTILAVDLGATKDEVLEAFGVALAMGGTPVMSLGTKVMGVLKEKGKWE
jgi:AhpD family alkylhydroperoxidase